MDNGRLGVMPLGPSAWRRIMTFAALFLAVVLVGVGLMTGWLWYHQERIVFQPPALLPDAPPQAQRVNYVASDNHPLFGYIVSPAPRHGATTGVVVAFHGNADLAVWLIPWARELADRAGVTVLLAEYRGYAGIPGPPTYLTAESDALGALDFARTHLGFDRVVLFGHSLGSAVAAHLAAARPGSVTSLILQSPFTSARDMASRMMLPPIPGLWRTISRVHYDTRAVVAALDVPVWVAHGVRDIVVPARMGRDVHRSAKRRGELLVVERAGHNDLPDVAGEAYWNWLIAATRDGVQRRS